MNVIVIDVRGRSSYTDFLVIASGTSDRHVEAVATGVATTLKKDHENPAASMEGLREGRWALVDFGDAVLHTFHQYTRELYDLEELWKDAPQWGVEDRPPVRTANG